MIKPAQSPDAGLETRLGANQERKGRTRTSVLTSANLGRPTEDSQGFKPDLGNPAVRDYRGLCQEDEKSSCCTKDGGRPSGAALWEEASNSRELLQPKAAVVNVHG